MMWCGRRLQPRPLKMNGFWLMKRRGVKLVEELTTVSFADPLGQTDYLIITHPDLNRNDEVQAYANYRSSEIGGGYATQVANIDGLIERYGYGVEGPSYCHQKCAEEA